MHMHGAYEGTVHARASVALSGDCLARLLLAEQVLASFTNVKVFKSIWINGCVLKSKLKGGGADAPLRSCSNRLSRHKNETNAIRLISICLIK